MILESDFICIQETWLEDDTILENLKISNYQLHLNSNGKGIGNAIYYKKEKNPNHEIDIKDKYMQLLILTFLFSTDRKVEIPMT